MNKNPLAANSCSLGFGPALLCTEAEGSAHTSAPHLEEIQRVRAAGGSAGRQSAEIPPRHPFLGHGPPRSASRRTATTPFLPPCSVGFLACRVRLSWQWRRVFHGTQKRSQSVSQSSHISVRECAAERGGWGGGFEVMQHRTPSGHIVCVRARACENVRVRAQCLSHDVRKEAAEDGRGGLFSQLPACTREPPTGPGLHDPKVDGGMRPRNARGPLSPR